MKHSNEERLIAMGGLFQAAVLADQVANTAMVDLGEFEAMIRSLFVTQPEQTIDVYGTTRQISSGLKAFVKNVDSGNSDRQPQIIRYTLSLLQLQRQLDRKPQLMEKIGEGINEAERQVTHFSTTHSTVIAKLADIYSQQISPLSPRILVEGNEHHLKNPENANKIRALLLSGIRAAMLWRQCGGSRWQLLLKRRQQIETANYLLTHPGL